mmetsp:Transcript_20987/g.44663  ORF Transcript_20987/g.44663 Transcript_20987/m.44663 type:complete len:811 (-) Transcript_20987:84-2516(-)
MTITTCLFFALGLGAWGSATMAVNIDAEGRAALHPMELDSPTPPLMRRTVSGRPSEEVALLQHSEMTSRTSSPRSSNSLVQFSSEVVSRSRNMVEPGVLHEKLHISLLIYGILLLGPLWSAKEALAIRQMKIDDPKSDDSKSNDASKSAAKIQEIAGYISDGASAFLQKEMLCLAVYISMASILAMWFISPGTAVAFLLGSVTSCACGFIGMKAAVFCNSRTAYAAWQDGLPQAFDVAMRGGSIMGFTLVSLALITMYTLMLFFSLDVFYGDNNPKLWEALAGFGFGGSSVALFARVGGGVYTKAADVGADLSGKNEYGMKEDDPRNPACIADNVGDNVGDVAGMGADLFGSLAESTCAALILTSGGSEMLPWGVMCYPVLLSASGVPVGLISLLAVRMLPLSEEKHVERALKAVVFLATALQTPMIIGVSYLVLPGSFETGHALTTVTRWQATGSVLMGLWAGLIIGFVTEYYTSHSYRPVREIAESQTSSAATGIIFGLALGYESCVVPTLSLGATIVVSFRLCGMYGVALAALGMLSTLTIGLTIDCFGPISDNAGGLAEMAELPEEVRERTDALDAAGNTTAAVGKGFAIGSAALVSLALFGAFCEESGLRHLDLLNTWCFLGLLLGAMLPFLFSALTMRSVGKAANAMVQECFEQFPKILKEGKAPDYQRCISICTTSSLKEMIAPGLLVILSPIIVGACFGKICVAGLLAGSLTTGIMMAVSMSNSGGAWDNSKKFIKGGGLGEEHAKGPAHHNSVTGDTVGDPMKDTSGPSLNILIKLSAITSLVCAPLIVKWSGSDGGPRWL